MFQHKGDSFREEIEQADLSGLINPLLQDINTTLPSEKHIPLIPEGTGSGNFQFSEVLYLATMRVAERNHQRLPPFVRRMIPIAMERDGNRLRNRGQHFAALKRYALSLEEWYRARSWSDQKLEAGDDGFDQRMNVDMSDHNIGRLTRKIQLLSEQLTLDPEVQKRFAAAVINQHWETVARLLSEPHWKSAVSGGSIRWLDEQ
jgi:hypothetical protein